MKDHLEKIIPFAMVIIFLVLGPAVSIIVFVFLATVGGLVFGVWFNLNLAKKRRADQDKSDD